MEQNYHIAKEQEVIHKGIPANLISESNELFLTRKVLTEIANMVSGQLKRKLTSGEINELIDFIKNIPANSVSARTLAESEKKIAQSFIANWKPEKNKVTAGPAPLGPVDNELDDYQQAEIKQMTPNENQYKYSAFADRLGASVIDPNKTHVKHEYTDKEINDLLMEVLTIAKAYLDPGHIDQLISRFSNTFTNYFSINLPHQVVQLDSRNRSLGDMNSTIEYRWYLHSAGDPGRQGDIRLQDTLQQVIQMNLQNVFFVPAYFGNVYNRLRLGIQEFNSQAIIDSQYSTNGTYLFTEYYHFEVSLSTQSGNSSPVAPLIATPAVNGYAYNFRKPIGILNSITMLFFTPLGLVDILPDFGTYTITYGSAPYLTPTLTTTGNPQLYDASSTGVNDLVMVSNSNSGDPNYDAALTSSAGWPIIQNSIVYTASTNTYAYQIQLNSPTTPYNPGGGTQPGESNISVYYVYRRISIPIEFLSLEQ